MVLTDPKIINLIVCSLVGPDVPANTYSVAQSEWADGTRSDVLYASKIEKAEALPPILIESQYYVDQDFMIRLISYSSNVYKRYKVLPIVLVIVTKSFSKASFKNEFNTSSDGFLLEASCKFWAKQCFLLTADAVSNYSYGGQAALGPMVALGYFTTHHTLQQIPSHHCANPTLKLLLTIVKGLLSDDSDEVIRKSSTTYLINQIKRSLEHIIADSPDDSTNKKIKTYVEEGLLSIEQLQSDLDSNDKDNIEESTADMYTAEDFQFIESFSKPGKNKNWKNIFNEGKKQGLFKSYKSSDTLKSSYYHIRRRKEQKDNKK
ncbi:hypothetical protein BDF20DRAFT_857021 [Mycotypha africana]|uniref:uncharacterized protein n=1 Tax=Mycotypha africana TaxID=64632 RepID=UPI0022FFE951|nr:uncharacterized protein BDF20DRAFT_857021 [Mycotypha africana]KAI8983919.1 hypothetical protein BDF20DRAFT_857021 [Mycotypha africana]